MQREPLVTPHTNINNKKSSEDQTFSQRGQRILAGRRKELLKALCPLKMIRQTFQNHVLSQTTKELLNFLIDTNTMCPIPCKLQKNAPTNHKRVTICRFQEQILDTFFGYSSVGGYLKGLFIKLKMTRLKKKETYFQI